MLRKLSKKQRSKRHSLVIQKDSCEYISPLNCIYKSFLINGIYLFDIRKFYTPYIGYGIGIAFQEATQKGKGSGEHTTLAYQLKAGVEMEFNRNLSLLTGYKYSTTNEAKFGFYNGELTAHTFEAGLKLQF